MRHDSWRNASRGVNCYVALYIQSNSSCYADVCLEDTRWLMEDEKLLKCRQSITIVAES